MTELRPTLEALTTGLTLATDASHTIVLPSVVGRVRLLGPLFEPGQARMLPQAMPVLRRLREVFDGQLGRIVLVTGHVDRAGSVEGDRALSQARADAVGAALGAHVLPAGTTFLTHGCGASHRSLPGPGAAATPDSERIEVFLFRGRVAPPPPDVCRAGGCPQYARWVARAAATIDLTSEGEVVVVLVDELGQPLRFAPVQIRLADGTRQALSADRLGRVRPAVAPGSSFDVVVSDVHEGGPADALVTPSGRHFSAQTGQPQEEP
jgi:OmpA family